MVSLHRRVELRRVGRRERRARVSSGNQLLCHQNDEGQTQCASYPLFPWGMQVGSDGQTGLRIAEQITRIKSALEWRYCFCKRMRRRGALRSNLSIVDEVHTMRSTRSMPHVVRLAGALLCAACANSSTGPGTHVPPYVSLITRATTYGPDDAAEIDITNHTEFRIGHNVCSNGAVEKLTSMGWKRVPDTIGCTDQLFLAPPGAVSFTSRRIPATATPGTYRVRFAWMVVMPEGVAEFPVPAAQLVTNAFAVR